MHIHVALVAVLLVLGLQVTVAGEKESAAKEIAAWAGQAPVGEAGRPLPLAGSWMAEKMYGPERFTQMIEEGHHVLITFLDPSFVAARREVTKNADFQADRIDKYYRPGLEYARKHKLPIAIRGWNWSHSVTNYQQLRERHGEKIALDQQARMVVDGKLAREVDPFGPVEPWREWGRFWFGNGMMREIQEIYPDPPMVIFLNNNEGPKVRGPNQIPDDYERFVKQYGKGPHDALAKARAIRKGYQERYAAMFGAARESMVSESWRRNVKFVAYNSLWGTGYIGSGNRPRVGIWFEADKGWLEWRMYDGGMPELYDNDWQPGKRDYRPHSMQTEAMNYYSVQPRIFERDPDFYWSSIVWEGGRVSDVWRGRRSTSKPYLYISRGERWDFARYEGWIQFCLWTTRARTLREFRWPPSDKHAYDQGAFMSLVRSVDRPWQHEILREFWRFGQLVPNPEEKHPWTTGPLQPKWVQELERWYLLTCDANPPRAEWQGHTKLRVFALALLLGEAPNRRWLVYAHAPRGAVPGVTVRLPGYGDVKLASVPRSGSFFLVREQGRRAELLLPGGPDELTLRADPSRVRPGGTVRLTAAVAHAPGKEFEGFTWDFGDGETVKQQALSALEHRFTKPGHYVVTVTDAAESVGAQVLVLVGDSAGAEVLYDLPLDQAFAWTGPWDDSGAPDHKLVTYRHVPNLGKLPPAVLSGGRFVEDKERGRVLELAGGHDGVWLIRNGDTMMDKQGHANQTISFRFKAETLDGRQVLYAQGFQGAGFNIYLDGDTLYAGSWAPAKDMTATGWFPIWGRNWPGHWLKAKVTADRWHHVSLVLKDATEEVQDDRQHLYLDGKRIAGGPGVRIPRQYALPRIGRARIGRHLLTRFHDQGKTCKPFRGRISGFVLAGAALPPKDDVKREP